MSEVRLQGGAVSDVGEITPESVTERLSFRLRQLVGTGRPWSYQRTSNETGIDVRTLKAYVQGAACPNLVKYKRLLHVLGPAVGTELNEMKGWLPRSERIPPEALDLGGLLAALNRAVSVLDGRQPSTGRSASVRMGDLPASIAAQGFGRATEARYRKPLPVHRIDTRAVVERLAYRLRRMIGPGRSWSLPAASEATGIDQRTLQSYLNGTGCPNLARYVRLGLVLGPEIGVELAFMIGWEPRHGAAPLEPDPQLQALRTILADAERAVEAVLARGGRAPRSGSLEPRPQDRH